jgi:hypothetical protein
MEGGWPRPSPGFSPRAPRRPDDGPVRQGEGRRDGHRPHTLADGATYTARTELDVPSLKIEVDVVNTGYRKMM